MGLARPRDLTRALLLGALVALLVPTTASAADSIYWADRTSGEIRVGNLDGTGSASNAFADEAFPVGVTIDAAENKIYWAANDDEPGAIRVGDLDDSSSATNLFTGEDFPSSVTIDPAEDKLYWAAGGEAIRVGNLDGTGSPSDLFANEDGPQGIAIDPGADKLYWAAGNAIRVGNLDGSGSASNLFTGESSPSGVTIDSAASKIYWGNTGTGTIRVGNLDGSGSPSGLFEGIGFPLGVALDPAANMIYWAVNSPGEIDTGNLEDLLPANLFTGEASPSFPALLRSPAGTGLPAISGGNQVGEELSCSEGSWAPDLLGAFLYQAPRSFAFQWRLNGSDIPDADQPTYTPTEPGTYTCRVAASNHAGSTAQTSDPHSVARPPPTCEDISRTTPFEQSVGVTLECSGQGTLDYEIVSEPSDGVISDFDPAAGTLTYTPDSGFVGEDSFTYLASNAGGNSSPATATITVNPPPPTCGPAAASTGEDQPIEVALECSGQGTLDYELLSEPADGEISAFDPSAGTLTYTPDPGFTGADAFAYRASNAGGSSSPATATITVIPPPTCGPVSATTDEDQPTEVTLECSGQGTLDYEIVSEPSDGQISDFDSSAGTLTYTPDPGFMGADSFTYRAQNAGGESNTATATITVEPPPPTCENVPVSIPNDTPAEISLQCSGQGTLTYELVTQPSDGGISDFDSSAGTLTYTPEEGFTGNDSFTYRASNAGGDSNIATARITVEPPPPTCENVSRSTPFQQPAEVSLDCSGRGTLAYEIVSDPADGEISDFDPSTGTLTYIPDEDFFGEDSFTYRASNAGGDSNTATAGITVEPPPPTCEDTSTSTPFEQPAEVTLDCSGRGTLAYEIVSDPIHGQVSDFDPSAGTLTYTPDSGFTGTDSLAYRASNMGGPSGTKIATITVEPPPPTCEDVSRSTPFEQPAEISLDCSGQGTLTYEIASQPGDGEISDFEDSIGTLTYTPEPGFFGEDSFTYRARNAGGDSSGATVTIAVSPRSNRISFGNLSHNKRRGTAKLRVRMPSPGALQLARTKKVRPKSKRTGSAAAVKLKIKPRRRARQRLRRHGRVRVRAKVTFNPEGGEPRTKSRRLRLRLRRR